MANQHRVPLARLYEKTSAAGRRYFVGRMGGARLLLFLDERAEGTDPVWQLFAVDAEADKTPNQRQTAESERRGGPSCAPVRKPKPEAKPYQRDPDLDDPLPF